MALVPQTRTSHPLSRLIRPIFEHRRVRGAFGVQLVAALVLVGVAESPVVADFPSGASDPGEVDLVLVEAPLAVVTTTERQFQLPVELLGVSQGFSRYHPGVDLRSPLGSPVRSVAEGVVRDVFSNPGGYGRAVVVEHGQRYSSMYAHLGRIFVEAGSPVDRETVIAEVGMSGYSTGPHLHLEIYNQQLAVNPAPLIGD